MAKFVSGENLSYFLSKVKTLFVPKTRKINNKELSADITLTASDVGALPSSTTIPTVNNGTLTIQKNGANVGTFSANQSGNSTINITVPTGAAANKGVVTTLDASANLPTSNAVKTFVEGKGYITSSGSVASATKATQDSDGNAINSTYLKKSGGTLTGVVKTNSDFVILGAASDGHLMTRGIRGHDNNGTSPATSDLYLNYNTNFPVHWGSSGNGTLNADGTISEAGTLLSNKYLGKTAKASDASKLNGQEASYYLNYNNFTNKPTIPSLDGVVKKTGAQTVGGTKTFSDGIKLGSSTERSTSTGSIDLNGDVLTNPNLNEITQRGIYHCTKGTNTPTFDQTNSTYDLLVFNSSEYDSSGAGSALVTQVVILGWKWWIRRYGSSAWGAWERFGKNITIDSSLSSTSTNPVQNKVVQAAIQALQSNSGLTTSDLLSKVYPVGSIYMSINNTSPASFLGGSWTQIGAGYALWTASSGAGGTISAGLPNITGDFGAKTYSADTDGTGAFRWTWTDSGVTPSGTNKDKNTRIDFNASRSSSIYGNSTTVQPPAYKVYAWRRTS